LHAKSRNSARERYLDNLSTFVATPGPQAIALIITMPDDLANYNITGMPRCTGNGFAGGCAVRATAGNDAS